MFLRLHAPQIWAADFFTVPTLTFRTLSVFVLLDAFWNKGNEAIVDELGPAGAVGRVS